MKLPRLASLNTSVDTSPELEQVPKTADGLRTVVTRHLCSLRSVPVLSELVVLNLNTLAEHVADERRSGPDPSPQWR